MSDILAEVERLIAERDEARANAERLWTTLAEQDNELEAARDDVLRLTAERDVARTEVRRLIAERDQPESRPKGREVGRFGLDGHYLDAMEPTRPTDEDIWREGYKRQVDEYRKQWWPR